MPETEAPNFRLDLKRRDALQRKLFEKLGLKSFLPDGSVDLSSANWISKHHAEISEVIDNPDFAARLEVDEESALNELVKRFENTIPPVEKAA